jgi:peroxiredoxin
MRYIPSIDTMRKGLRMTPIQQPEVGQPAPPIIAATATGEQFDLAQHTGEFVVVYFYPRANTPG